MYGCADRALHKSPLLGDAIYSINVVNLDIYYVHFLADINRALFSKKGMTVIMTTFRQEEVKSLGGRVATF